MDKDNCKKPASGQQKRRACDECRGRKLACSKELDGCARCKREGIKCAYSIQKPMGRPRKRVHVETVSESPKDVQQLELPQPQTQLPIPTMFAMPEFDPVMGMDLDLSFMDMSNTDINFLDLLDPNADFPFAQEFLTIPMDTGTGAGTGTVTAPTSSSAPPFPTAAPASQPQPPPAPIGFSPASGFWPMSDQIEKIDFDANTYALAPPPPGPNAEEEQLISEQVSNLIAARIAEVNNRLAATSSSPNASDRLPSLSPPSSSSSSSSSPPSSSSSSPSSPPSNTTTILSRRPPQQPTCSCLSSLYLALESLRTLPQSVTPAMRITRAAARVAHDCVRCPSCGDIPLPSPPPTSSSSSSTTVTVKAVNDPPIAAIQSMMMLGALLPSLSHAYMSILEIVDREAQQADSARQRIKFTLSEYGGLWGVLAERDPYTCGAADKLEGASLEPSLWRLTVRALLKIDVYGIDGDGDERGHHDNDTNDTTTARREKTTRHFGLKDIIGMMEERSRNRHQIMDAMIRSGELEPGPGYVPLCDDGGGGGGGGNGQARAKPTCLTIIDVAKRSMNDLIIP